jgi:phosphoglycolate phosphatase-like HAD superfamily hydrolase
VNMRRRALIFDVDGTLCDVRTIRYLVEPTPGSNFRPDFGKFHSASSGCPPHRAVMLLAQEAHRSGLAIVVVTGREEKWRALTEQWLASNQIPYDELKARNSKDYRPDHVIKAEIETEISKRFVPLLAVDDRPDIIAVWHRAGIVTARVDEAGNIGAPRVPLGESIDQRVRQLLGMDGES